MPIIIVVIVIAIAVAALITLGQALFSGKSATEVVEVDQHGLMEVTAGRSVTMTARGPIVANEDFRSYQITITPDSRKLVTYTGYLGDVLKTERLSNNVKAYDEFVHALSKADMAKGVQLEGEANDTRGICATGQVYEFDILNDGKSTKNLWTSTCKGSRGSFTASVPQVQSLFFRQIPNVQTVLRGVNF